MPTYEYKCNKCEYRFEKFQRMTDDPIRTCPRCHGEVRRLISAGNGFIFKGSGFYATDYRKDSYKKSIDSESSSDTKTKPEAKSTVTD